MNGEKMTRRETREELFKLLFQVEIQGNSLQDDYDKSELREEIQADVKTKEFVETYIKGLEEHKNFLQEKIQEAMTDWDFQRIGYVEKSLLRLAAYEIYFEGLPVEIIVNEAVELAKIYGDIKTHEFINGVLAKVIHRKK